MGPLQHWKSETIHSGKVIDPEMTSSFFINKEKSRDLKLEDILPASQLPSNKKIDVLGKAIHNIIQSTGNDYDLTEEQKKLLIKSNNDVNESHFKKKLEDRFLEYISPHFSSSSLKEANLDYRQCRRANIENFYPLRFNDKDETNLRNIPEKKTLMGTLMLTNKEILLCYEAPIKRHLFKREVVEFGSNEFKRVNRFTSLEKFLKKAEELGIHYDRLHEVFEIYAKLCMPQLQYILAQTRGNTRKAWDTILDRLTVQKELSAINNDLRQIIRYPGSQHNNSIHKFYDRLYCLYLTAAHIQFQESEARDSNLTV